ncbi:hypothetical protein AB0N99_37415 [Streptomyces sp. NPDC093272]|uniref:hypothetical protein n=1 Tax=unclassified Streptomyces TaxID=2593676 RepID=UPI0034218452
MLNFLFLVVVGGLLWLVVAVARKVWSPARFGGASQPALDPRLRRALLVDDPRQRRLLLKWQEDLLEHLRDGERITAVVAEQKVGSRVAVVTSRRLLITEGGSRMRVYERERISGTRLGSLPGGDALTFVDGPGRSLRFAEMGTANALALAIDRMVEGPATVPERPSRTTPGRASAVPMPPRDIPALLPEFYQRVMFATGTPYTPENTVALIELVDRELYFHAVLWFDMTDDAAARREFDARFSGGGPDDDRLVHLPDDMIDFLRARVPGARGPLRDIVRELEDVLSGSASPLHEHGASLPADLWSDPLVPPRAPRG